MFVSEYFPVLTGLLAINRGNGEPLALTAREKGYGTKTPRERKPLRVNRKPRHRPLSYGEPQLVKLNSTTGIRTHATLPHSRDTSAPAF